MTDVIELKDLRAVDLGCAEVRFTDGQFCYRTSGRRLGYGGMGQVWAVERTALDDSTGGAEMVVAKTFRDEVMSLLRQDEIARQRHAHCERVLEELQALRHPNVLPVLLSAPIADNYLFVSPLAGLSLLEVIATQAYSPRERVRLMMDALQGLSALHERGIVHCDFTLYNVLLTEEDQRAAVFDFDLVVAPRLLAPERRTYRGHYQGRIAGSPEYSVAPELLDEVLSQTPICPHFDVYAIGTALFALFSNDSIYGSTPDLSSLFYRISGGMVHRASSLIQYPPEFPEPLKPIIETCLEREPDLRYDDAGQVIRALEVAERELSPDEVHGRFRSTIGYAFTEVDLNLDAVYELRVDRSLSREDHARAAKKLSALGYLLERGLGRVKGHPIFLALPDPGLVETGRFPDDNTYRKVVTAIDVAPAGGQPFVDTWLSRIYPILSRVRQGFLTPLYKVVHHDDQLLLFSEYLDDPRFGSDLTPHSLPLEEVFALGLIVGQSIARLHAHGLGHNNVSLGALVFKAQHAEGTAEPLLLGLVEPSFAPQVLEEDVANLTRIVAGWIRQDRVDVLPAETRAAVSELRDHWLGRQGQTDRRIETFLDEASRALGWVDPNFDLVRSHGGDIERFAQILVRRPLYHRVFGTTPRLQRTI